MSVDVEGIAKEAAGEAVKIAAAETATFADEETAQAAAAEADKRATEEAARAAAVEAGKKAAEEAAKVATDRATKATGDTFAPGAPSASTDAGMGAAGNDVPAAGNQPTTPEAPPARNSLGSPDNQRVSGAPSSSGAGAPDLDNVDGEVVVPMSRSTEDVRAANDDAADMAFLQSVSDGFKEAQERFSRRWEKLQRRAKCIEMAEQEFLQRADEAQAWYADKVLDIRSREAELAAAREAFILERAAAEMKQEAAAKENADFNGKLIQRKVELDSREDDLVDREQKLADKLKAKDDEIQELITKQAQELEGIHRETIQALVVEHAGKLKEAVEAAEAAKSVKTNLDARVKELEEKLAASSSEIHVLKESAQKAAYTLGELQSSLSSKNTELQAAGDVNADLKLKLSTLEGTLEIAREKERILLGDLEDEKKLLADAEEKFVQLRNSLALWTDRLVDVAERLTVQLATMGMKSWGFSVSPREATSARLTLFFEGLIGALDVYHKERAAKFAAESRKLLHDVLFKVLVKITCRNPGIDLSKAFTSLPAGTDTSEAEKLVAPIANRAAEGAVRVQGHLRS